MLKVSNPLRNLIKRPPFLNAGQDSGKNRGVFSIFTTLLLSQKRDLMVATQKENSNLVEKVTGYEMDPDKRKRITDQLKTLGMTWSMDKKCWIPKNDISFDAIEAILNNQKESGTVNKESTPPSHSRSSVSFSEKSPFTTRIDDLLKNWEDSLGKMLPRQIKKEKFLESLRSALINASQITSVSTDEALRTACMKCAELGLTPGPLQECYFSTRDGQVEFLLGYKGLITLARRTCPDLQIDTNVVRKGDKFSYVLGTKPQVSLEQLESADPEDIEFAYVLIRFPGGVEKLSVIDSAHAEKRRLCSKGINSPSSPWKKFRREMWLKTALREALRFVNLSPEISPQDDFNQAIQSFRTLVKSLQDEVDSIETKKGPVNTCQSP